MNIFITLTKSVVVNGDTISPLQQYKDKLFSLYVSVLNDSNHQLRILAGSIKHMKLFPADMAYFSKIQHSILVFPYRKTRIFFPALIGISSN